MCSSLVLRDGQDLGLLHNLSINCVTNKALSLTLVCFEIQGQVS